jgi:cytidine deaminase
MKSDAKGRAAEGQSTLGPEAEGPELVFALVGAVGTRLDLISDALTKQLRNLRYTAETINLIDLVQRYHGFEQVDETDKAAASKKKMDQGDAIRVRLQMADALAVAAVAEIQRSRMKALQAPDRPNPRHAYILHSLKRPEEVATLREIYGDSFYLIAGYAPEDERREQLGKKIGDSRASGDPSIVDAQSLMDRDKRDRKKPFGQDVSETFPLADVFVNTSQKHAPANDILRFVELLFGRPFLTPSKDEFGMFHATGAALRSADLARQVGAAILSQTGQILALGTNDVPRFGGGLYWPGDIDDQRDYLYEEKDLSYELRRQILVDALAELDKAKLLAPSYKTKRREFIRKATVAVRDARIMLITEYSRAVHAEMAAITDAARIGISLHGATLYTTTFPCHNCAKHIVAAGLQRLVYVEPYPKSQVRRFYRDSIVIDPVQENGDNYVAFVPFVGVAPRRYKDVFSMRPRKTDQGEILDDIPGSMPTRSAPTVAYLENETTHIGKFSRKSEEVGLRLRKSRSSSARRKS